MATLVSRSRILLAAGLLAYACPIALGEDVPSVTLIEPRLVHLRNQPEREWSSFPETPDVTRLSVTFDAQRNGGENCMTLRQQDVKQPWFVSLNGKRLAELVRDENDMSIGLAVPADVLKDGENSLVIEAPSSAKAPSDDIRVGQIQLHSRPLVDVLSDATLEVTVVDSESNSPIPSRITVVDASGSLASFATKSSDEVAIRPGTAFTATGRAVLKLPVGRYAVFAGRGFEYSLDKAETTIKAGETERVALSIRREVPTPGFVACDTHVHTLTHSGHGDAAIAERMITLAAEAIELPIATDHNIHVDYDPIAKQLGVRRYLTPVIGNEVTTPRGHFNIFPVLPGARVPDHRQTDWGLLFDDMQQVPGVKIAILNHARDLHGGVRPFGPALYNSVVAENLDGWPLRFNGMEVVNSGATQSDVLQLFHDWMGLLNRGYQVTPVGSSDSHDVARHFVGQGRTYIRCDDGDPANLDVSSAVTSFLQGQVMVSYGLLVDLSVNGKYSSGDLVPVASTGDVQVDVRVLGPHWVQANRVLLFANGVLLRDEAIRVVDKRERPPGIQWTGSWKIPRPRHDLHLVAIAMGPGIESPYWRTAKPYQPTSPDDKTHIIGCSGAVWLDADGDNRRTCAREYAERMIAADRTDINKLFKGLNEHDEATVAHVCHLLRMSGVSLQSEELRAAVQVASSRVQAGFRQYQEAWRENDIARTKR